MLSKKKTVVLGLSGGVDSAVSCYLLLKQGYNVIPVFMQNWDTVSNNDILGHNKNVPDGCESNLDYLAAKKLADFFHLQLHKVQFIKQYWNHVFKTFLKKYSNSVTPNPDVLCNKYIKFGEFKKYALKHFKADYIATGHYARIKKTKNGIFLIKAKDQSKDQTYFLCDLDQEQLKNVIFPVGNLLKSEVRQIAKDIKLPNWDRKDSTGICFIGKRNFQDFLKNYIANQPGNIIDITSKKIVGKHIGTMYYTIGQNKDLHLSGQDKKYYVCKKDVKNKIIYVCNQDLQKKYLLSSKCWIKKFNFVNPYCLNDLNNLEIRFRHLQKLIKVSCFKNENNCWCLHYDQTMSVAQGQYAVIYKNNICIGGGEVKKIKIDK